ncbi:phage tail tape measure protein [Cytobacillus sp. FSL K6-0265]|uniref:phage tail tape measure protein n=1 Tax=Cytobacillus sp. FSL K6-0265 TaxID=2921448 RepID=UPI0030FA7759
MADVGTLRTRISLDSAQFEQGMAGINRQLRSLQYEQRAATSSGTGFARGITELRAKSEILQRTFDVQQAKVRELARRYEEARRSTSENSRETQNAQIAYQRAVAEMRSTENALRGVTQEIERQTNPWNVLSRNMNTVGSRMQEVGRTMASTGRTMTMSVTLPILGVGGAALKAGMDFEAGMSKVEALTQASKSDMKLLEDQAKELGATTKFSATQAAEGMAFLGMAGWKTNEILAGMPGLLSLAAAENMELGRAADITSNIMSAFSIEASKAGHVADVLAMAATNSNTNVEQLGQAMTYVAPVANTLGWNIEETAAAIMAMSDAGIQGEKAGAAFATSLQRLANPTAEMSRVMDDLNIKFFDAEGTIKPMPTLIGELEKATNGMTSEQKAAALSTLFGAEAYKNWAVVLEAGSKTLGSNTKMLEESEGAANKMAETMNDNTKGAIVEFKSALEGVGIALSEHLLPVTTDLINKGTEMVRKFGELDESTQKNIIKMGLFAVAIGPAALVAGNLTTAIGGLVKVGGTLTGLLGRAGGTGLLGRIGMMGVAGGPVGLAVAGVAALAIGVAVVSKKMKESKEVNLDHAESLVKQQTDLQNLTNEFEKLREKNKLTTDEMLRYRDIQSEMKFAESAEQMKALTDEQEKLLKKSGLTNEEMDKYLSLNDDLIKLVPDVDTALSAHGDAVIGNADALSEANEKLRENITLELENQRIKAEAQLDKHIRDYITALEELKEKETERDEAVKVRDELEKKAAALRIQAQEELNAGKDAAYEKTIEEIGKTEYQLLQQNSKIEKIAEEVQEKLKSKQMTEEEIQKTQALYDDMINLRLAQVGINEEGDKGLKKLDEAIEKTQTRISELNKAKEEQGGLNEKQQEELDNLLTALGLYRDTKGEIKNLQSEQQNVNNKINEGTGKAKDMNRELGKDVNKDVDVDDHGTAKKVTNEAKKKVNKSVKATDGGTVARIDRDAKKEVTKNVNLNAVWSGVQSGLSIALKTFIPGFAKGTDYHKGGPFIAGEEGFELGRLGNRWEVLDYGLHSRPAGYEVFTHNESKRILSSMSKLPAYANGATSLGTAERTIQSMNNQDTSLSSRVVEGLLGQLIVAVKEGQTIVVDGKELGATVEPHVTQRQLLKQGRKRRYG